MQFAHGAIFQDGRHQLSGSNISGTVQRRMDFLVSNHRFLGSNNPIKIFPGRLDEAEVKIQNGGTKWPRLGCSKLRYLGKNHRGIICMVNFVWLSGFRKLPDISLNQFNVKKLYRTPEPWPLCSAILNFYLGFI